MEESIFELPRRISIFSLKKMCLIKLSSVVCNNEQLLDLILKCHMCYEFPFDRLELKITREWKAAQNKANEIISQMCSNVIFRGEIKELFWPMSYRIIMWKHIYAPSLTHEHLRHIVWTDVGKINNVATAKHIIENKKVDVRNRFILACKLCLSEEIHNICLEMSDKEKRYYSTKYHDIYRPLLVFWIYTFLGSDQSYSCFSALRCAIKTNLWDAVKSLYRTMKKYEIGPDERNELERACLLVLDGKLRLTDFQEEDDIEICYFLLSQIEWTDAKREKLNMDCRFLSLSLLVHNLEYERFIEELQSEDEILINTMLQMVFYFYNLEITYEDNDYQSLFINVWRSLPSRTKTGIATCLDLGVTCVVDLITHNFPFVLKAKGYKKIKALLNSELKCSTLETPPGFNSEKWMFLQFLIREEVARMSSFRENVTNDYSSWNDVEIERVLRFIGEIGKLSQLQDPKTVVEPPMPKSIKSI